MSRLTFKVELQSPVLPGSGDGFGSIVDQDLIYDDLGLPYLPARRFKGLLRESAAEVLEMLSGAGIEGLGETELYSLFGSVDQAPALCLDNLYLPEYDETRQFLMNLMARGYSVPQYSVISCFSTIRHQTAIDENGIARTGSLRSFRVLDPDLLRSGDDLSAPAFSSPAEISRPDLKLLVLLGLAAANLRFIGSSRNRGLGAVNCRLADAHGQDLVSWSLRMLEKTLENGPAALEFRPDQATAPAPSLAGRPEGLSGPCARLDLDIHSLSGLIFTTDSADSNMVETYEYIPGGSILGAFAARFIKSFGLSAERAHQDEVFKSWFVDGSLCFGNAYLCPEEASVPAPYYLQTDKDGKATYNLFQEIPAEGAKRFNGYMCRPVGSQAEIVRPQKSIGFHLRRSSPGERLSGSSSEGGIFNYESLAAGQCFRASVSGPLAELRAFYGLFGQNGSAQEIRLGRSLHTQYGRARIIMGAPQEHRPAGLEVLAGQGEFILVCQSPAIVMNDFGFCEPSAKVLNAYLWERSQGALELVPDEEWAGSPVARGASILARSETRKAFVSHWHLPRPTQRAFAAGSCFKLRISDEGNPGQEAERLENALACMRELLEKGLGERCHEGYGQISLESVDSPVQLIHRGAAEEKASRIQGGTATATDLGRLVLSRLVERMLLNLLSRQAVHKGLDYCRKGSAAPLPSNSLLRRLESMLKAANSQDDFQASLKCLRNTAVEQLDERLYQGQSLHDWLKLGTAVYYAGLHQNLNYPKIKEMADLAGYDLSRAQEYSFYQRYWSVLLRTLMAFKKKPSPRQ